mmetsp:Transcript_20580/g.52236  ORF Transcript_20580/g.52236 Transcript_20580/m.52236 type:complete len:542 (-) Transcript_20580:252-1877(-)
MLRSTIDWGVSKVMEVLNGTALARLWETKAFSDVTVVFTQDPAAAKAAASTHMASAEAVLDVVSPQKPRRTRGQAAKQVQPVVHKYQMAAPAWPQGSIVVDAHTLQLLTASKVFEKQMLDNADMAADRKLRVYSQDALSSKPLLVVGVDSAEMLQAVEPFMRLAYIQGVPADIMTRPDLVLLIYQLADQLESHVVMSACTAALAAIPPEKLQTSHISFVLQLFHDTELATANKDLQQLQANCETRLLQLFGDAAAVIHDTAAGGLRGQFCGLPFAAVLHWIASDKLATDHENTIMALLSLWWEQQKKAKVLPAEVLTTQMVQLAAHVRVQLLSPLFTPGELLPVPWFQPRAKLHTAMLVAKLSSSKGNHERVVAEGCPPAWMNSQPRPKAPSAGNLLQVEVTEEQIKQGLERIKLGSTVSWSGPTKHIMGFSLNLYWQLLATGADVKTGLFLRGVGRVGASDAFDGLCVEGTMSCLAAEAGATPYSRSFNTFLSTNTSGGYHDVPKAGPINAVSDLARWLREGKLVYVMSIEKVDGVVCQS